MKRILLTLGLMPMILNGAAGPNWNDYAKQLRKEAADLLSKYNKYDYRNLQSNKAEINNQIRQLESKMAQGILEKKVSQSDVRSVLNSIAKVRGYELNQAKKAKLGAEAMRELRKTRGAEVARVSESLRKAYKNIGQDYNAPQEEEQAEEGVAPAFDEEAYKALGVADGAGAAEVLGVAKNASQDDIKKAWKKLTLQWHPDKHPDDKEKAEQVIKLINWAYDQLKTK